MKDLKLEMNRAGLLNLRQFIEKRHGLELEALAQDNPHLTYETLRLFMTTQTRAGSSTVARIDGRELVSTRRDGQEAMQSAMNSHLARSMPFDPWNIHTLSVYHNSELVVTIALD